MVYICRSKVAVRGGSKVAVNVGQKLPSKNSTIKNSRRREIFSLPVGHRKSPRVKTEELLPPGRARTLTFDGPWKGTPDLLIDPHHSPSHRRCRKS